MNDDSEPVETTEEDTALADVVYELRRQNEGLRTDLARSQTSVENARASNVAFLSNLSREIRTPLNGILGCLSFLEESQVDDEQGEMLRVIRGCAEHLMNSVQDVLDYASVQVGSQSLEPVAFDLILALEEVTHGLSARAHEKGLELFTHVDADVPRRLVGDVVKIQQILHNLLTNAVKFTAVGYVIARVRYIGAEDGEVSLRLEVEDSGQGISKGHLKEVMAGRGNQEPTGNEEEHRFGRSGMGLAICGRIIEHLGGTMGAESEEGVGSLFWFDLKVERDSVDWGVDELEASVREATILLVDPNAKVRLAYQAFFDRHNLQGECVSTADEAFKLLDAARRWREPYKLVIAEIRAAGAEGGELARQMANGPMRSQTGLILTAVYDEDGGADLARQLGADEYLVKPIRRWDLVRTIGRVLNAGRAGRGRKRTKEGARRDWAAIQDARRRRTAQKRRVLLAEDNVVNQKVAKRMLEKLGCRVDVAWNGKEALDMAQRFFYELMFIDCQMPGMDGFEATERIREYQRGCGSYVPIVALTANAMGGDRERCLACGMDDYLAKPVTAERLEAVVRHWKGRASPPASQPIPMNKPDLVEE